MRRTTTTAVNFIAISKGLLLKQGYFYADIQDPENTGRGGKSIWGQAFPDEFQKKLVHSARGIVSMANSGPNTNNSQFFITYAAHSSLNNVYTVFGRLISGYKTLDAIEEAKTDPATHRPETPIVIERVTIHANPIADKQT